MTISPIAYITTQFPEKFGIPRQSGLTDSLGKIIFEREYRDPEAIRGLEGFSHIWLIWEFSANRHDRWQPTVRPPRLGGNERMGVFATRSPFRPNRLGLSCLRLERIETDSEYGPVIYVRGADLMDGTPIYDIKPYVRYADSHPDAVCGYVDGLEDRKLEVVIPEHLASEMTTDMTDSLTDVLSLDPRPSFHDDPDREYGLSFSDLNVRFKVSDRVLTVTSVKYNPDSLPSSGE